jgi:hypothetical protein
MSEQDPKRLLEGGGGEGAGDLRSLLAAGRSEVPTHAQLVGLAAKIGILGGLGGAGAAGAAGAGGGGAGAGGAGAGGAGAVGGGKVAVGAVTAAKAGMTVKVIGVMAVASAAGAGAVVVSKQQAEPAKAPVGLVASETPSAANARATAIANANANANAEEDAGAEVALAVPSASKSVARAAPKDEGPEAEMKLVESARDALRSARPAEALALCNDHAKRFPKGAFAQECEVTAVEALVKTGRKDEAKKRAERFKTRFPGSAATRRLDVLVGD